MGGPLGWGKIRGFLKEREDGLVGVLG